MILQISRVKAESRNGKTRNYEFYRPTDLRKCFAWIPVSQIKQKGPGKIYIPDWLWQKIKTNL